MKCLGYVVLEQLGANKFLAMTGSKVMRCDNDSLELKLKSNKSKANKLIITLNSNDTYNVEFINYKPAKMNVSKMTFTDEVESKIKEVKNVYISELQNVFTKETLMYCTL